MDTLSVIVRSTAEAAGESAKSSGGDHELLGVICAKSSSSCILSVSADCAIAGCKRNMTILIFPFLALFVGSIAQPVSRIIKLPYTLFLLLVGIVIGLFGCAVDLGLLTISLQQWVHLNPPAVFFYVFLAPLIFEAAFNTQLHVFRRVLVPVLSLASLIVLFQVFLIGVFQKLVVRTEDWTWWAALMFGSMLSATDPISVTATLKSVGASETLNTLIEGESLLNDGTAFVLWEAFFDNTKDSGAKSIGDIVVDVFRLALGGALMGVAFGLGALVVLSMVYDEFEVETSITIVVAFLGFWTAQSPSRLSGVICNVCSGLILSSFGRPLISSTVRGPLSEFWELLGWIANTIVFVHAGVLVSSFTWSCSGEPHQASDYLWIFGYFAFLQVIRFGLIFIFLPLLRVGNKWFGWKEAVIAGASGLRGAVSLILALEVGSSPEVPENVRTRVVLWTTGIVLLSLVFNGLIIKPLLHWLKLDKAEKTREDFLRRARSLVVQRTLMILDMIATEGTLKKARWSYVAQNVLPPEWIEEVEHKLGYEDALDHIGTSPTAGRASLDVFVSEAGKHRIATEMGRRLSEDYAQSIDGNSIGYASPPVSPGIPSSRRHGFGPSPVKSQMKNGPTFPTSPQAKPLSSSPQPPTDGELAYDSLVLGASAMPRSPTISTPTPFRFSHDPSGVTRFSVEHDILRYGKGGSKPPQTEIEVHQEIEKMHKSIAAGNPLPDYTGKDYEVKRRMLTSMLQKVRSLANATLAGFAVLVGLDDDIQEALDANDARINYDMYNFLDRRGLMQAQWWHRIPRLITEGTTVKGEVSIQTAHMVIIVMTHVLKEDFLHDSAVVYCEAEALYEGASTLLNRLEAIHPFAMAWVESEFAVLFTFGKQDDVLEDMLAHGTVDDHEYHVLQEELLETRRKHFLVTTRFSRLPPMPKPRQLLQHHALFAGMDPFLRTRTVQGLGKLHHLRHGQILASGPGDLIVVLEGALRPVVEGAGNTEEDAIGRQGPLQIETGGVMHWCFPTFHTICGPDLALIVGNSVSGPACAVAHENVARTELSRLRCCDKATVWTLPEKDVSALGKKHEQFRSEITRSLARQMVLESISDVPAYTLSRIDTALNGAQDEFTVIGRASKLLERLPYMNIVALHTAPNGQQMAPVHGPGVLLNGTVRVSIVDTSGLVGSVSLLHQELTGPALLPSGALVLEELVPELNTDDDAVASPTANSPLLPSRQLGGDMPTEVSSARFEAFAAQATEMLNISTQGPVEPEGRYGSGGSVYSTPRKVPESRLYAHVLIEDRSEGQMGEIAVRRLKRWTGDPEFVDQNGRYSIIRHTELQANDLMKRDHSTGSGKLSLSGSARNLVMKKLAEPGESMKGADNV